jgi:hypothetical protein
MSPNCANEIYRTRNSFISFAASEKLRASYDARNACHAAMVRKYSQRGNAALIILFFRAKLSVDEQGTLNLGKPNLGKSGRVALSTMSQYCVMPCCRHRW